MSAPTTRTVLAVIILLLGAGAARADRVVEAKQHFDAGNDRYAAGRYEEALGEFSAGYALVPNPKFLLNLGQTYRKLGRLDEAREALEKYAATLTPGDRRRADVALVIADIDRRRRAQSPPVAPAEPPPRAVPPAPSPSPPPAVAEPAPPPRPAIVSTAASPRAAEAVAHRRVRITGAVLTSAGGVAVVIGGVLVGLAVHDDQMLSHPPANSVYDPTWVHQRDAFYPAGLSLLSVGGALVVGGAGTLIYAAKSSSARGAD
jgi:hypothetical protein